MERVNGTTNLLMQVQPTHNVFVISALHSKWKPQIEWKNNIN